MQKITNFDRPTVKSLRSSLEADLATIALKYGITMELGNARFSEHECNFKFKLNTIASDGTPVETKEAAAFRRHAPLLGIGHLSPGDHIRISGQEYEITGYNTRAPKSPIGIKALLTGKKYKCSVAYLKQA
jgi:hypothetical protein